MRWIVKLTSYDGLFRYYDVDTEREVEAVASALEANPNHWVVRTWPVSQAEYAAIIGDDNERV